MAKRSSSLPLTVGPVDRVDLLVPLLVFVAAGIATAVLWFPGSWPVAARVAAGVAVGLLSWMFPYLNRVLEGD